MNSLLSRYNSGYSMIEVLVALFVLSIGMLGIAGLFVATIQDSRAAIYRSKATTLAWDMAERIRANRAADTLYNVAIGDSGSNGNCAVTNTNATATNCSISTLAQHDVFEWKSALADRVRGLPDGNGTVVRAAANPPTFAISVTWTEGDGVAQSVQVVTQL